MGSAEAAGSERRCLATSPSANTPVLRLRTSRLSRSVPISGCSAPAMRFRLRVQPAKTSAMKTAMASFTTFGARINPPVHWGTVSRGRSIRTVAARITTMPNRPLNSCRYPSCSARVPRSGFCSEHGGSKRAHPEHYTGAWPGIRAAQLEREPRCRACGEPATTVDHILPLTPVRGSSMPVGTHDPSNLQSLCDADHLRKTAQENEQRFAWRASA